MGQKYISEKGRSDKCVNTMCAGFLLSEHVILFIIQTVELLSKFLSAASFLKGHHSELA